jgi:PAS domain S-box-containing protein
MKDESKTKKQLINELTELRQQIANVKSSEEEFRHLKDSNEKFVKAFMQSSIPMALTTFKEGRFIDVSNAFLKFTGLRQDEVIGRTSREIGYITEEQRRILFNELNKKGCVENLALKVGTKSGEFRDGLFNAVMMTLNNEKYLLKVMADITEHQPVKESLCDREERFRLLETANDGIMMDVTEKKRLEPRLQQARKMEAIGTFADGVAHDLNNLFLVIQECVSLMHLDIGSAHHHYRYLKTIEAQVASGADLTEQLPGIARGEKYVVKPINIKGVVAQKAIEGAALRRVETILLVDDEKMTREVTRELLESLGYLVYIAQSGQEAVAVYMEKRQQIDLVILDIVMPGISGGETFDRLREINPEIRVLLSSGYSINGEAKQILDRGCNGFLPKPFRLKELAQNVRRILD